MKRMSYIFRLTMVIALILSSMDAFSQIEGPETPGVGTGDPVKITVQPDPMMVQHWAMPTLTNPAATGDVDFIRIRGGARLDYLGSHQSPKNFLLTGDSPFKLLGKKIGAGLIINSNSYFLYRNLLLGAQGSYKFNIKNSTLSVGLQIGYFRSSFKGSELKLTDLMPPGSGEGGTDNEGNTGEEGVEDSGSEEDFPEDSPEFPTQDVAGGTFDVSLGVRYEHPYFHIGISALHLTNSTIKLKKENESATDLQYIDCKVPMSLYFEAGGNIGINNSLFTLQPSLFLMSDFNDFQGIAEMRATYNQKFTFGVDYRWNRAMGALVGLTLKNFYIGYAWEYDYKSKPKGSTGNHELVIGYQFKMDSGGKNTFSHRSIRIM